MRLAVYIALSEKIQTAFTDRWLRPVRLTGREGEGTAGTSTRMQTGDIARGAIPRYGGRIGRHLSSSIQR